MSFFDHHCGSHHLVVGSLIHGFFRILQFGVADARIGPPEDISTLVGLVIDLIECHPIFDLVLIALHHALRVAHKEVDQLSVHPAAVFLRQVIGHLKVAQGDHRFNPVSMQFIKQIIIETKPGFIGLCLIALREDPTPGNRSPEALEAQFGKQFYIVFISVEKINSSVVGIVFSFDHAVCDAAAYFVRSAGHYIAYTGPASIHVPGPL